MVNGLYQDVVFCDLKKRPLSLEECMDLLSMGCDSAEETRASLLVEVGVDSSQDVVVEHPSTLRSTNSWERVLRRIEKLDFPTGCLIEGQSRGIFSELLMAVDLRVAVVGASIRFPRTDIGPWPGVYLSRMVRELGLSRARGISLFTPDIEAERASELGLLSAIVDDREDALAWMRSRFNFAGRVGIARQLLLEATDVDLDEARAAHLAAAETILFRDRPDHE